MLVYNVRTQFFPMKSEADAYRKSLGLPPKATTKIVVNSREALAALLNGLCNPAGGDLPETTTAKLQELGEDIPDFVPAFVRSDWEKRKR